MPSILIPDLWSIFTALCAVVVPVALYGAWKAFNRVFLRSYLSSLWELPRPKSPSFYWGNFREIFDAEPGAKHMEWVEEYGLTLVSNNTSVMSRMSSY
jgi:hypothetical protein